MRVEPPPASTPRASPHSNFANNLFASAGVSFTTFLPDPATHAPSHPATGLGVCASCLSCLLVLISPFYEHRPYRTATAETRVLEDKTLIGAMVEIDANVEAFHVIDELGWDCRAAEVAKVGCDFHG